MDWPQKNEEDKLAICLGVVYDVSVLLYASSGKSQELTVDIS